MHIYTEFSHIFPFTFLIDAFHIQSKLVSFSIKRTLRFPPDIECV